MDAFTHAGSPNITSSRTRSFGGCVTCRSRHLKCDEGRPGCSNCAFAKLSCGGYERNIFFDLEDGIETGNGRCRRPLFTEQERRFMSESLVASISPRTALRKILEIDDLCEDLEVATEAQIIRGPFTAYRLSQRVSSDISLSSSDRSHDRLPDHQELSFEGECLSSDTGGWVSLHSMHDDTGPPEEIFSSPFTDLLRIDHSQNQFLEISDDVTANELQRRDLTFADFAMADDLRSPCYPVGRAQGPFPALVDISLVQDMNRSVPADAVFLLKHYSTTVLPLLTVFRHTKTPWHILFIPHVKGCLAALTLGEVVDHASLVAFYGTLSISAYSLGGMSHSSTWLEQASSYHQQARYHTSLMLQTTYNPIKSAKYKSILMAILTMVQISMISGRHDQTECYLLEAEKLIRVKGLNRKKSRKIRLLHHCYAFERIFHESLFISNKNSTHRQYVRKAIEASGALTYSADSLSFRLGAWSNLEVDMLREKGREESENDLHLEIPGEWTDTLYPEIFGVPESYLLLLSMIIRLRREKDHARTGDAKSITLQDFAFRAKSLERCIKYVRNSTVGSVRLQNQVPHQLLDNMLEAMQHALAIYFYRRIYDLETSLLQHKVLAVRDCLRRCESAQSDGMHGSARLIWPAFIAACEAEDIEIQQFFAQWFELAAKRSGLQLFREMVAKVEFHREEKSLVDIQTASHHEATWSNSDFFIASQV